MSRTPSTVTSTSSAAEHLGAEGPCAVIVLVSPVNALVQCDAAVLNATHAGAVTITCEIAHDESVLETLESILVTVDYATITYPGVPVVLVGHDDAEDATLLAADTLQGAIAGVVVTRSQADGTAGERAA